MVLVRPLVKSSTRELTPVIGLHALRDAMAGSELLQNRDDLLTLDALIGVYCPSFPVVLVDDRECPKAPAALEGVLE